MRTLEVKAKGKTVKGSDAVTVLYLLLTQGVELGCHFTDMDIPEADRITWRPIRRNGEVIGSVSWNYRDKESAEIVRALELGARIQKRAKERRDVRIKVEA